MAEEDFLSFIVNETFKLQKSGEVELSCLEHKLNDYGLDFMKGEFIPQSQMLRFQTQLGILDIPTNWSVFSIDNDHSGHAIMDKKNDIDYFFSVIQSAWNPEFEKILVTQADGFCYLVGMKLGEDSYLHDLLNPQEWLKVA
jgi:hypothetical protein